MRSRKQARALILTNHSRRDAWFQECDTSGYIILTCSTYIMESLRTLTGVILVRALRGIIFLIALSSDTM